jgi:TonB family protein
LFRTLAYPIEPRQLLAALSAAAGIEEEIAEADIPTPSAPEVTVTAPVRLPASAPAPATRPAARSRGTNTPSRAKPYANAPARAPRQPTPEALAAAHRLEVVTRPKGYPSPSEPSPARSAFLVGAGVVVVLGALFLAFKIFNTPGEQIMTASQAGQHSAHFPPEVVKLVADTEAAFQQDDYKTARTDVAALQQIAPDHPRLPFFESLLKRLDARQGGSKPSATHLFSRHTSAPPPPTPSEAPRRPGTPPPGEASEQPAPLQALGTPLAAPTDTIEPHLIQRVNPEYPPEAERKGAEGTVEVSFTVSPEGKVSDVIIVSAEPSDIFDRAAVDAVRRWRYEPKKVGGVPVEAHLQARVQFKLR